MNRKRKNITFNDKNKLLKQTLKNKIATLKIKNKKQKIVENDKKKLLQEAILFEENKQYNQFSIIYYSKIKLNSIISE